MKILSIEAGNGRDLYGQLLCEHCDAVDELKGGYNDAHWHQRVLPAWHCGHCGRNRAGELRSAEVTARNRAQGVNGV